MNPYHGVVTPEYLLEQTKKQMDLEKNDVIYVKTIEKKRPLTEMDIEMVWLNFYEATFKSF